METGKKENRFILFSRLLWLFILLAAIIVPLAVLLDTDIISICMVCGLIALCPFIASLLLSCKKYRYNDDDILVYAGWYHHYIKVNGETFDEHNTIMSMTALYLSCTLDDGAEVEVSISLSGRIALKINGRLQTPVKRKKDDAESTEKKFMGK